MTGEILSQFIKGYEISDFHSSEYGASEVEVRINMRSIRLRSFSANARDLIDNSDVTH